jgi:hypothetical protein
MARRRARCYTYRLTLVNTALLHSPRYRSRLGGEISGLSVPSRALIDQRGQLLRAALGFAGLLRPAYDRTLWALRDVARFLVRHRRLSYCVNWRSTQAVPRLAREVLHEREIEHSPTSATGTGWARTPWHATQRAAWEALRKAG